MNISIRLAIPSDAGDMSEIIMRSWETAYKDILPAEYIREKNATRPEQYKKSITAENQNSYVIQLETETVGIMRIGPAADGDAEENWYELHYIYLHPDYYRRGIGTKAMEFVFDKARNLSKSVMVIWVFAENANSIRFYEKCGFTADGKTKENNIGKKIIRMRRDI